LHATWWGQAPPGSESILGETGDPTAHAALLNMLHPGFAERYGDSLEPEVMEMSVALLDSAARYLGHRPGPTALVHRDFRPDNLLVGPNDVAVVDWQTVSVGPALSDLSYFLGGALLPADRAAHEAELLARYRAGLHSHGVELDMETIESGYRRYALDGLVMAIGASQVVGQTQRGDEMFCAMAERSAMHALESGSLAMLD
jgi:aminoglycoside phosphotransferase (APT) family kinase protein